MKKVVQLLLEKHNNSSVYMTPPRQWKPLFVLDEWTFPGNTMTGRQTDSGCTCGIWGHLRSKYQTHNKAMEKVANSDTQLLWKSFLSHPLLSGSFFVIKQVHKSVKWDWTDRTGPLQVSNTSGLSEYATLSLEWLYPCSEQKHCSHSLRRRRRSPESFLSGFIDTPKRMMPSEVGR